MNDKWIDIETRIAYQEDTIQQLNQALIAQQVRIDQLEKICGLLRDSLAAVTDSQSDGKLPDEPPPHY